MLSASVDAVILWLAAGCAGALEVPVVAKQAATLDRLCGGRLVLGVGAGWLREEFDTLDAVFGGRGPRLDEAIG
jgi:alkanesulfonate monooxygenase SsuD/methylene tetrahydromethanopterin reductase-like flavin-dependent oxidoreductase (luciferase family)